MDAKLYGIDGTPSTFPMWDLFVDPSTMIVPMITGDEEAQQQANLCAALLLGSIPQLPTVGVDWLGFLAENVSFPAVDSQIRDMMHKGGHDDFYPSYDLLNGLLSVMAVKNKEAV